MKAALTSVYPGIRQASRISFGGNQRQLKSEVLQHCGCGVVAALDLIRYLHLYHPDYRTDFFTGVEDASDLPEPVYDLCAQRMRNFVPALYPIGTTGFSLAGGLNRYFRRYNVPLKASWGVSKDRIWQEIGTMLQKDLPVILSVGNQFPKFWQKKGAQLHRRSGDEMRQSVHVHAHYVTVVGMDDEWLRISSWGQEYYLSKEEFLRYRNKESLNLLCNIVRLRCI
jgi:hypothetical protein